MGSKRAPGAYDGRSPGRRLGTAVFSGLLRRGFGLTVSDTHGMKVLNLQVLRGAVSACRNGSDLFVAEIPVAVTEMRPPRTSILQRVPRTLVGLAKLRRALAT